MQVQSLSQNGSNSSKVNLPESIFGQRFNAQLVDQLLSTYISNSHPKTKGQKIDLLLEEVEENLGGKKELVEQELEQSEAQSGEEEE